MNYSCCGEALDKRNYMWRAWAEQILI